MLESSEYIHAGRNTPTMDRILYSNLHYWASWKDNMPESTSCAYDARCSFFKIGKCTYYSKLSDCIKSSPDAFKKFEQAANLDMSWLQQLIIRQPNFPQLKSYYQYTRWQSYIYSQLKKLVSNNLQRLEGVFKWTYGTGHIHKEIVAPINMRDLIYLRYIHCDCPEKRKCYHLQSASKCAEFWRWLETCGQFPFQ